MPRLTNSEYYRRHRFLRYLWQRYNSLYALLHLDQQYDIHNYYRPDKDLTKAELIVYRKDIKQHDGGLPARASKAYVKLHQAYRLVAEDNRKRKASDQTITKAQPAKRHKLKRVSVRAVARPEPDWDRFAYALLRHVRIKMEGEKEDNRHLGLSD